MNIFPFIKLKIFPQTTTCNTSIEKRTSKLYRQQSHALLLTPQSQFKNSVSIFFLSKTPPFGSDFSLSVNKAWPAFEVSGPKHVNKLFTMRYGGPALLHCIYFAAVCSYSVFLLGFFPIKTSIAEKASGVSLSLGQHTISPPDRRLQRTVLVLIDALRADFVNKYTYLPYLREQIVAGHGYSFVVRTHPPTVTLPRIKVHDKNILVCR